MSEMILRLCPVAAIFAYVVNPFVCYLAASCDGSWSRTNVVTSILRWIIDCNRGWGDEGVGRWRKITIQFQHGTARAHCIPSHGSVRYAVQTEICFYNLWWWLYVQSRQTRITQTCQSNLRWIVCDRWCWLCSCVVQFRLTVLYRNIFNFFCRFVGRVV